MARSRRSLFGPRRPARIGELPIEAQHVGESGGITYGETVTLGAAGGSQTAETTAVAPEDQASE